jgi:hypothetical protein
MYEHKDNGTTTNNSRSNYNNSNIKINCNAYYLEINMAASSPLLSNVL